MKEIYFTKVRVWEDYDIKTWKKKVDEKEKKIASII